MNFDLDLFEKTEGKEFGEFTPLALGGHEIKILDAREYTSEISGKTSLKVTVDIAGSDEQAGYFQKQYDENPNSDKKWSNGAIRYLSLANEQIAYLKGFITSLEKSNPNFKFNTKGNWEQLKGLKLAGQFGLEEYQDQEGEVRTATKLVQFRSLDKLGEIKIPKVKLITGEFMDYEDWKNRSNKSNGAVMAQEELENSLPFEI